MKKSALLFLPMLLAASLFAQGNPSGPPQGGPQQSDGAQQGGPGAPGGSGQPAGASQTAALKSPIVNPDGTVTFNLYAPTAISVSVNGQLYPVLTKGSQTGKPLVKDDKGIWSVTIGPFPAAFYDYHFIVDGVAALDPINKHVAYGDNWFLVPGDVTNDYLFNDVPHGTVSEVWYPSPTLGMVRRRMSVYTPPGYEDSTARYPVVYLLHGGNASEHTWLQSGRVAEVLDNLIAQGKAVPMIVVFPNGNETQSMTNADADVPSALGPPMGQPMQQRSQGTGQTGQGAPGGQGGPGGPGGTTSTKFPDSIAADIVPWIDKHYRTRADSDDRAVTGLSLGSGQAMLAVFRHPDVFGWPGVFGEISKLPDLPAGAASKLHKFYISTPAAQNSMETATKALDAAGIKYIIDSHPEYSSEFWRPGFVAYASHLFKSEQ